MQNRRGILFILSSPSGAGKSTLARSLMAWDNTLSFSVSATTRSARSGEIEGREYFFKTDKELHKKLLGHFSNKIKLSSGRLFGSETIIWDAEEKKRVLKRYNTKTVDMESLGVAQAAIENNCSFLVVRAISDTAKQNLPRHTLKSFSLTNSIKISSILLDLAKHPNELPSLLKLAQNSQKAQACLQNVAKLGFGI